MHRARAADGEWDDDSDDGEMDMSDVDFLMLGVTKRGADPKDDPDYVDDSFCHKNRYRKRTFKVVKEMPFSGLFPSLQRTRRFEGSGVTYANGSYYVVFDSLKTLGQVDLRFSFRGPENRLVGPVGDESQFEGISYNAPTDSFFVLRESFEHEEHGLVPVVYELKLTEGGANYKLTETCMVRFALQDVNKGFESLHVFERDGKRHMLGLCESNFCKTILGPDPPGLQRGNGRLVWATYHAPEDQYDECIWNVEKVIVVPEDAFLLDYAAIAFKGDFGEDVAIVSQEDAAVWVGKFDWETMEFVKNPIPGEPAGQMYHFPRTDDCHKQYCNVEGAAWIDGERLVFTSDKSKRIQDHRCMNKDQSVHIMSLP
ncbi:hypothetical protein HXX76_000908 [Chlamydomonas incerta]|uniref:Uncharacterized protein n=1 Tax=Chlamydomonas incerta TaxID=51695 RepID=A0A835WF70_CHLIN|nr:hypothetical protein HXX76_000908 [Chlamydomonas incerta]|eukprot:KAG2446320.1 hypothetical protein HXX76_000908 [Chlamydomonas incerta]